MKGKKAILIGTLIFKKQTEGTAPFKILRTRVNIDILGISELNGLEWANLIQMTIIPT